MAYHNVGSIITSAQKAYSMWINTTYNEKGNIRAPKISKKEFGELHNAVSDALMLASVLLPQFFPTTQNLENPKTAVPIQREDITRRFVRVAFGLDIPENVSLSDIQLAVLDTQTLDETGRPYLLRSDASDRLKGLVCDCPREGTESGK